MVKHYHITNPNPCAKLWDVPREDNLPKSSRSKCYKAKNGLDLCFVHHMNSKTSTQDKFTEYVLLEDITALQDNLYPCLKD